MTILERGLARLGHVALYGAILILVTTGTLAAYFSPRFAPTHVLFTYLGIGLVFLHAAAALWHQFICRDTLLARMLPKWPKK
jgi:cytochrome b561